MSASTNFSAMAPVINKLFTGYPQHEEKRRPAQSCD